jgi:hypothetical protein
VAVIVLPGMVEVLVRDTEPPVGIEAGGGVVVVVGITHPAWLPCAEQLTPGWIHPGTPLATSPALHIKPSLGTEVVAGGVVLDATRLRVLEAEDATGSKAEVFAVICKVPAVTVPLNTNVFDVVLVFVIEESVRPVVPSDIVKSVVAAFALNPVEVTTIEAPVFPGAMVEEVEITGAVAPAVSVEDKATREVPLALIAVAKALYIGAIVVNVSTSAVTEEAPDEDATLSLSSVGTFPFLETVIKTLYDVGVLLHPDVDAVIILPGAVFPVRETVPPAGTGAVPSIFK